MNLLTWALQQLHLDGAHGRTIEAAKSEARRLGKGLLAKFHPDRNPGDAEAEDRFKAINSVLQNLDKVPFLDPVPRTTVSISYYPAASPQGASIRTDTVRRSYFNGVREVTHSSGLQYDARRVVSLKPR